MYLSHMEIIARRQREPQIKRTRGVGAAKLEYVERQLGPGTVELMRRIKSALDPRGVLNPGKKVPPRQSSSSSTASNEAA